METWQKTETIAIWIIITALFVCLLIAFIIWFVRMYYKRILEVKTVEMRTALQHQQFILENSIQIQENERERIAADIHDSLIGKLLAVKIKEQLKPGNLHAEIIQLLDDSIDTARRISHDLSPPLIEQSSLIELIEDIIAPLKDLLEVHSYYRIPEQVQNSNFKIQLVRVIQEIFTNISKHANATSIEIMCRQSSNGLILKIRDNGIGFSTEKPFKGLGLKNIEIRIQFLKGQLKIKSTLNQGTTFYLFFEPISYE